MLAPHSAPVRENQAVDDVQSSDQASVDPLQDPEGGVQPDEGDLYDEEREQEFPGSFLETLPQFFVFPLILVATLSLVYLSLRVLTGGETPVAVDLIADVRAASGEHSRWQALHALADALQRERIDLDSVEATELVSLWEGLSEHSPMMRQDLLAVRAYKDDAACSKIVVEALHDENREVRLSALRSLAQTGTSAAVGPLAEVLAGRDWDERFLAIGALAGLKTTEAQDALASLLGSEDTLAHRNAVFALAQSGDDRARGLLSPLMMRESYSGDALLDGPGVEHLDTASREAAREGVVEQFLVNACRAAEALDDRTTVSSLRLLRQDDPSTKVRSAAMNALHTFGQE